MISHRIPYTINELRVCKAHLKFIIIRFYTEVSARTLRTFFDQSVQNLMILKSGILKCCLKSGKQKASQISYSVTNMRPTISGHEPVLLSIFLQSLY